MSAISINPKSQKRINAIKRESKEVGERFKALAPEDQSYMLGALSTLETIRGTGGKHKTPAPPDKKGA